MPVSAISNPIKNQGKKTPNGNYVRILVFVNAQMGNSAAAPHPPPVASAAKTSKIRF